jgi:Skp family chaperone for outer membrane proteins
MAQIPATEPDDVDDRLRQLLAVEQRLQDLVRRATDDADRSFAAARDASERRVSAAREEAGQVDADRARAEQIASDAALAAIERDHRSRLDAIINLPESRVDALARWAILQAIGDTGESP